MKFCFCREKRDRGGWFVVLERLKKVKEIGEKYKYDVSDLSMLILYNKNIFVDFLGNDKV